MWGAQGGRALIQGGYDPRSLGGLGGYSIGSKTLTAKSFLYVAVGGKGQDGVLGKNIYGGWNGGGNATWDNSTNEVADKTGECGGAGGGATHIATSNRGTLANYINYKSELLLVAGGGGGGNAWQRGGNGGGQTGGTGESANAQPGGIGATQTTGYAFGQGQSGSGKGFNNGVSGGGGGYYGGFTNEGSTVDNNTGGGGSGYIGGVTNGTTTAGVQSGNGKAVITWHPAI